MAIFSNICQYLSIFANICQHLPRYGNICKYLPILVNICQSMAILANICQSDLVTVFEPSQQITRASANCHGPLWSRRSRSWNRIIRFLLLISVKTVDGDLLGPYSSSSPNICIKKKTISLSLCSWYIFVKNSWLWLIGPLLVIMLSQISLFLVFPTPCLAVGTVPGG